MKLKIILCAVLYMCPLSGCSGQGRKRETGERGKYQRSGADNETAPTAAVEEKHSHRKRLSRSTVRLFLIRIL